MKKVLFALVGLLLATSAFAQYGGNANYGPQYTWPKDRFLESQMSGTGTGTFGNLTATRDVTFTLPNGLTNPPTLYSLTLGTKPSNATAGYEFYAGTPYSNQFYFDLTQKFNGTWLERRNFYAPTGGWTPSASNGNDFSMGNWNNYTWTYCDHPVWNAGALNDAQNQIGQCGGFNVRPGMTVQRNGFMNFGNSTNGFKLTQYFGNPDTYADTYISDFTQNPTVFNWYITYFQTMSSYYKTEQQSLAGSWSISTQKTGSGAGTATLSMNSTNKQLRFGNGISTFDISGGALSWTGGVTTLSATEFTVSTSGASSSVLLVTPDTSVNGIVLSGPTSVRRLQSENVIMCGGDYTGCADNSYADVGIPDKVEVVISDGDASINAGVVDVCGAVAAGTGGVFFKYGCETLNIAAGAGTYTTVNDYYSVRAIKSSSVAVLGGPETISANWEDVAQATGTIALFDLPSAGNTVGTSYSAYVVYTFVDTVANDYDVKIGADAAETLAHLACAIADDSITCTEGAGNDYMATAANPDITFNVGTGDVTAIPIGKLGNQVVLFKDGPNIFIGPGPDPHYLVFGAGGEILAATTIVNHTKTDAKLTSPPTLVNRAILQCLDLTLGCDYEPAAISTDLGGREMTFVFPPGALLGDVTLTSTANMRLNAAAAFAMDEGDLIKFIWEPSLSGSSHAWLEMFRSAN